MLDVFNEGAYTLTNRWIACYKILIYESANSWITFFRTGIYGLINRWVVCYKPITWLLNFIILRIKHWPLTPIFHPFLSPTHFIPYPARHIPSFLIPPFPLTSPPSEGLGEASFLSISFLPVFPSTPFCVLKDALLQCKRASFDV